MARERLNVRVEWTESWLRQVDIEVDADEVREWAGLADGAEVPDGTVERFLTAQEDVSYWHPSTLPGTERTDDFDNAYIDYVRYN